MIPRPDDEAAGSDRSNREEAHDDRESGGASRADGDTTEPPEEAFDRPLVEAVRSRIADYGSEALGHLPARELPFALRRVARFEPRRRARLAGSQIAAQLETDAEFRARVAARVRGQWPEVAATLEKGRVPPAADPVTIAAVAYLLRPRGWSRILGEIQDELERRETAREAEEAAETIASLREQLSQVRKHSREEINQLRSELRSAQSTIAELRRELQTQRQRAAEAAERAEKAKAEAEERRAEADERLNSMEAKNRRLRSRLATAQAQVETARRAARTGRSAEEARLRVLVDVLLDAAHGLRRELALPSSIERPADLAAEDSGEPRRTPGTGMPDDDPKLIDQLLTLPRIHLLVDGYNVTKAGYGTLPLADQRNRLMAGLEGLASRTKAEITCVFDGADTDTPLALSASRRVRLLFSDPGETADELIIRLVRAEPAGRPLAVVSSDQEIVTAVRREGARTMPATLLLRRLEQGG